LDVVVLGEERGWQVDNTPNGIAKLVQQMENRQPELIVVEATGGYQRCVVDALFHAARCVSPLTAAKLADLQKNDCDVTWLFVEATIHLILRSTRLGIDRLFSCLNTQC
jgi:hypothetical protein